MSVDFRHYHSYEETASLLKMWAAKYPDLVELYSVGQSFEGREIWQITITNRKTGKDTDKPAFFLEGGRHAGEISGIEAALYFIDHVLSGYGTDAAITALVDTKALYVRPNNNPDGNTLYHLTAQTLRSTVRPYDSDGDGLLDEDAGEDLDGDGFIRQMRRFVGPGQGNATKDPKDPQGRAMKRVPQGQGDYETFPEGVDNDLDGRYNEDGIGGLDLHRNYPENWRPMREATGRGYAQGGSGEFPLSEPETRAVFLFLMTHPNVGLAQSLDTSVPMILRGPSTASSEDGMYPEDAALAAKFDKTGMELTGYPWAGDTYHVYATRAGMNPFTGEPSRDEPIFGHGPDFGYSYYGVIWYGDEIWNGGRFTDYDKDGRVDDAETLRWLDENRPGKGDFQPWTPFKHPQLGDVEIGGFNPKFWSQNPPPDLIETWAKNEAMFNLYLARQLAQVKVASLAASAVEGRRRRRGRHGHRHERRLDSDGPRGGQARQDRQARYVHDHARRRAGAREGRRRQEPERDDRDRLAETRRVEDRGVAGEGRGDRHGHRVLHAGRCGQEGCGGEVEAEAKREARSQKPEARSERQKPEPGQKPEVEARSRFLLMRCAFYWLLTIVSWPVWRRVPDPAKGIHSRRIGVIRG